MGDHVDRADQSTSPHTTAYNGARRVLTGNWVGASTVPSRSLYPHQWSWDSAFVAIGLRHLWPLRAQRELETLLAAQWQDGRVPHIVFNPSVPLAAYFPSPDFWRSSSEGAGCGAPAGTETSGLVQPPVHAVAAWLTHRADPAASHQRGFLRRVYPRLVAWQRYLTGARDLGGHGLASIVHPWESGMDNSPCWDPPLSRIDPVGSDTFHRADLHHSRPADRPTDLDYGRYVRLAENYRDHGYRDRDCGHPFAVEDPAVNALLILSEHALAEIAGALGLDPSDHLVRAEELTTALVKRLWHAESGQFLAHDVIADEPIAEHSAAGLIPLVLPGLPEETVRALVATATGPRFGLGVSTRMVPSYDLTGHAFDPARYWRGPAWFNVNWLVERGLRRHGELALANELRANLTHLAATSRYAEYVDPVTGEARGTRDFSWTAAVTIDLLAEPPLTAGGLLPAPHHDEQRLVPVPVD
ncbi:MGH1-like glycoside hydrolase domain-containing protein [Streptomyces triticirhizae]|uniref:MGH1-like glycoside hydrolase domain-containing protein n=1 Tax=Streptomyces triticirhizae TaxID=2483353 RepID=UPI003899DF3D